MLDYSDAYTLCKGTMSVTNTAATEVAANNDNKKAIYRNCTTFTVCISKINNTLITSKLFQRHWFRSANA